MLRFWVSQANSTRGGKVSQQPLQPAPAVSACRRPAGGDRKAGGRHRGRTRIPDAARRHRVRQDLHHGQRDRAARAHGDGAGAEQDARGAALLRDARVLSGQRGRVLRFVLRLLPARSLCSVARPVHREGQLDQRAHRADAAVGDQVADGAARLRDRGHRQRDLRHRRSVRVPRHDPAPAHRREDRPARRAAAAGADAVRKKRTGLPARHLPRARRRDRRVPGRARRARHPHLAVRRRDRSAHAVRSAHRAHAARAFALHRLPVEPLCDAARDHPARDRGDQDRAGRAHRLLPEGGQAGRGAADRAAHALRPGDAERAGLLQGHRELFAPPVRPQAGRAAAHADRLPAATTR